MSSIKTVGRNGQVSLGKEYAGQLILVDELEPGVWILKAGTFIPDSERWLMQPEVRRDLDMAIAWAKSHNASDSDLDELERRVRDDT